MGTQQIDLEELKKLVTEAFNAILQPKFDRIHRRLEELNAATEGRLCFPPAKQRLQTAEDVDELTAISKDVVAFCELIEGEGKISPSLGTAGQKRIEGSSIKYAVGGYPCFAPVKQSSAAGDIVVEQEEDSPISPTWGKFLGFPGMDYPMETPTDPAEFKTPKLALNNLAAETFQSGDGREYKFTESTILEVKSRNANASEEFLELQRETPNTAQTPIRSETARPISAAALLQKPESDSENRYLVGEFKLESSETTTGNQFLDDYGRCMQLDNDLNRPEIKTPKVPELQNSAKTFKFQNGGNTKIVDSLITDAGQDLGMFVRLIWKPFEQDLSGQLEWVGFNQEIPSLQVPPKFVIASRGSGQLLLYFPATIDLAAGQGLQGNTQTNLIMLESSSNGVGAVLSIVLPQLEYTFEDPFWVSCDRLLFCKFIQALRAKLFEEGGPDMIQIGPFYESKLLAKEAIEVGKKKGRICLSQNPCSGYILWRHGSLNWLGGNSRLRFFIAYKDAIFPMVCFVDPDDVIKVVFQGLKVAISKLENCQNIVKAETVFKKLTLELHSRVMDEIRVQRLIPHESRYVLLQRHGIG
ncbi:unnamed protein product [Linum trigynum]|uniref:Uncharacterized protein n=1 Tax=Linum trigynum TaxID=586398 RepID=A0AAV2CNZ6_9ROSI